MQRSILPTLVVGGGRDVTGVGAGVGAAAATTAGKCQVGSLSYSN